MFYICTLIACENASIEDRVEECQGQSDDPKVAQFELHDDDSEDDLQRSIPEKPTIGHVIEDAD